MKKIFMTMIGIFLLIPMGFAHSPEKINLVYEKDEGLLKVAVKHATHNGEDHYIKKVKIYKNGIQIKSMSFLEQVNLTGLKRSFESETENGDIFKIEVLVYPGGELTQSFEMDDQEKTGVKVVEEDKNLNKNEVAER